MARVAFTAGRVSGFKCPPDKAQAFLWDATAPGLGLRVTPNGKPAYIFQGAYLGKDLRLTIGSPEAWSISQAQAKAREFQRLIDEGTDPRSLKAEKLAAASAEKQRQQVAAKEAAAQALTVGEAWSEYVKERTPHWGELHIKDHARLARAGGLESTRGTRGRGVTIAGPLHPLMGLALVELTPQAIEAWATQQGKTRPTTARLAWRLLRAFLTWCSEHPTYGQLVSDKNPAKTRRTREALGKQGVKTDALLKEQLPVWFQHVRLIGNPCIAAYLQTLLLTGARPGEVLALKWEDINTQWHGLTIRDKVEGERVIPLTPYVHSLIAALPRRNEWVFSSFTTNDPMSKPHSQHSQACAAAGIDGLTLHGLRRSFASLTEWLEIPAGVVAQIQGHKPSATAEKHYKRRPLDLLRLHHEKIEAWVLEQAGVTFAPKAEPGKLTLVG
ncbi:MAG TPA: integrase family protein [Burkholderiaceae bacterium]|mgnify:CR=1 FL=1|nr:integrase family protein [Burkholderiaceae bacterium]